MTLNLGQHLKLTMQNSKLRSLTIDSDRQWLVAPNDVKLLPDDIHVWRIELERSESQIKQFAKILSEDERGRAEKLYFQQHRQRFVVGRGILRTILGRYLDVAPQEVKFDYEAFGKPVLSAEFSDRKIWFNLSHCQSLALCAVSRDRPIGVDLEYARPITDVLVLAQQFFSASESALMRSLPPHQKQQAFFRIWTCKEAYLKATGAGISQLQKIEITLTPGESAKLNVPDWRLLEISAGRNSIAAVAVPGTAANLRYWQY
ncbi:4'-phosphopantetheinyl transferase [Calothrix sp. PCC 6303]|nr:4'-phosphopantetheinyl transferase [Calothrix sp. PCC 6303]